MFWGIWRIYILVIGNLQKFWLKFPKYWLFGDYTNFCFVFSGNLKEFGESKRILSIVSEISQKEKRQRKKEEKNKKKKTYSPKHFTSHKNKIRK